jgi:hypothetical protein
VRSPAALASKLEIFTMVGVGGGAAVGSAAGSAVAVGAAAVVGSAAGAAATVGSAAGAAVGAAAAGAFVAGGLAAGAPPQATKIIASTLRLASNDIVRLSMTLTPRNLLFRIDNDGGFVSAATKVSVEDCPVCARTSFRRFGGAYAGAVEGTPSGGSCGLREQMPRGAQVIPSPVDSLEKRGGLEGRPKGARPAKRSFSSFSDLV